MSDKDGKTEDATPKRLQDARKKGQIPKSQDLNAAASLLIFTLLLGTIGNFLLTYSYRLLRAMLSFDHYPEINHRIIKPLLLEGIIRYFWIFLPVALVAMVLGIIVNLAQTGFIFTSTPLKPDIKKLNPIEGFKNMFSKKAMFTLLKNLLKLILVFYMTYSNMSDKINVILNSGNIGSEKLFGFFIEFLKSITMNIIVVMFILGFVDYIVERRSHKKNLMMTKEEIKEEFKEMEGSQEVKSARKQKQRELAMGRMIENVGESTAIVTNPTHIAVAIRYDRDKDEVPIVMAKGAGPIAEKIKSRGKENKIPIIENKPLARAMYTELEVGEYVPAELYQAVAEILAIVYEMEIKNKGKI